jgi:hypothetical protein
MSEEVFGIRSPGKEPLRGADERDPRPWSQPFRALSTFREADFHPPVQKFLH